MRISRRSFCISAIAGFGVATINSGCGVREKVLKYPENAEECADLFEFFTAPDFGFEQAKTALKIIGEPRSFDSTPDWRRTTFPKQNDLIREIELGTSKGELSSMYIYYEKPVEVSLKRLESMLGASRDYGNPMVGKLEKNAKGPTAAFTNITPTGRSGPPPASSFGFFPKEPLHPGFLKGSLLFHCDVTDNNVKRVNFLRYERWTSPEN